MATVFTYGFQPALGAGLTQFSEKEIRVAEKRIEFSHLIARQMGRKIRLRERYASGKPPSNALQFQFDYLRTVSVGASPDLRIV